MSNANVEVVRELYELFPDLTGNPPPRMLELFHPEVRIDQTRNVFNPAVFEGVDGLLNALARVRETWDAFVLEPERYVAAGDNVVVVNTVRARGTGGGVEVIDRSASLHTLLDGRIAFLAVYPDPDEGLRAGGVA